jgi:sortase A
MNPSPLQCALSRAIERTLRFAGSALLVSYILIIGFGEAGRAVDASSFEAAAGATSQAASAGAPDRGLWSAQRFQAYQASLGVNVEQPVALMEVASIGLQVPIYSDTRELHLNRGAGLISGMALPGKGGNLGVAGHRDGFFRVLKNIKVGDAIVVRASGWRFEYLVDRIDIVPKQDLSTLRETADPVVTLVTCFPFYFVGEAPQRFIVRAHLDRTYSERKLAQSQRTGKDES